MKKTKTYILLLAVTAVWGTFAYKIIAGVSPNDYALPLQAKLNTFKPKVVKKMDTFSVQLIDKDPFLGTLTTKKTAYKSKKKVSRLDSIRNNITYAGMVKKQQSNQQIFVVNINNQQYLLKEGQKINDVKLIYGNYKKVVVLNNGKRQSILKQ